MKKQIVLSLLTIVVSLQASAYRFEIGGHTIAEGDDPQFVKDMTEGAKHGGTQVANGARDFIGAVGNATGLTNVIDSNQKTFADLGSAYACVVTLCYSEHLKKQELERVEKESKESYERQLRNFKKQYAGMDKDARATESYKLWQKSYRLWEILDEHHKLLSKKQETLRAAHGAAGAEILYRQALRKNGLKLPLPEGLEMQRPTQEFQMNMNFNYQDALKKLNSEIGRLEKVTGRVRTKLMAEFIRLLEEPRLYDLRSLAKGESDINMREIARVRAEKKQAYADTEFARKQYEAETK